MESPYDAATIVVLSGLEGVRRHPSMYIGSVGAAGWHHLVGELVDNAVDEAEAGHCRTIEVVLHRDGSCSVTDDGRGIPVDPHPDSRRPAAEVLLTTLHSGSKFQPGTYRTSAGLHGVGLSCVNALSAWLDLDVWRDGGHYRQSYAQGVPTAELQRVGDPDRRGTRIRFLPDETVLEPVQFSADVVCSRLEEVAFLHPALTLHLRNERTGEHVQLSYQSGVGGLLRHRHREAVWVHQEPITVRHEAEDFALEAAFCWTDGYTEDIHSFVNSVRTEHGGAHVDGLRAALAEVINEYARSRGLLDAAMGERITTVDILEGLAAVVAVRMSNPRFDGQTKKRLQSGQVTGSVRAAVAAALDRQLALDDDLGQRLVKRTLDSARARLAARLASRAAVVRHRTIEIDYAVYQRQFGIRSRNWHDSCSWLTDEGLLARHADLCDVAPDARMLDVCCGSGVVGNAFRGRVGEMVGLDITPEMVALASRRLDKVYQGTVYDLPFPDASFDLVVNREVLHLLPNPEKPVSEVFRVLKPGGQFIVGQIMPYGDEDAYWMFRIFKKKQPLLFQMFREPDFRRLLLSARFTGLEMDEYLLWESIDKWIDTHETTPAHRQEIYRLFYDAPAHVRAVHPFEVGADGSVRDQWRWCVYSVRKPC
ncbi:methyltransferase domain-containing protein [Paractinoplanes hotanensis]|uniref:DNA topoisomerase (ATP-hydrolyzing) n=1 Tax=Paractinoplanes hotanensis TaxID=2906497 RepID=A0ABT0YBW5_9ACTN|nr:methyltransferase domain-containing protein [Actinoplanes hotanensis]MCM4083544.1 methyltransferase domain-containing protein [Actinoplanes hotanensis]